LSAENEIEIEELNALFETLLTSDEPTALATSCELCAALEDALERRIVEPLLTTVYQATRNSGDVTRRAAREVAEFCGATHLEFDVDGIVEAYKTLVADATGAPLTWATDDLALQNIQARSRGPSVWLLANRSGRLLLSTGNRSEVACGYATMDGDTCGGLSPIAGIDKAFVRKWLVWAEKTGVLLDFDEEGNEIRFKAPALSFINDQQPTAELRPAEAKQTDEADLMPYAVLNLFERALIRDRLDLDAAISRVRTEAAEAGIGVDDETLTGWGVRFCRLWARTQWKRQRYAPGFPIDDYDLSPNSWTRYPILSEGFEREIADLQER
jgi:NAD+ synthase (glutamine-hydrolysing)